MGFANGVREAILEVYTKAESRIIVAMRSRVADSDVAVERTAGGKGFNDIRELSQEAVLWILVLLALERETVIELVRKLISSRISAVSGVISSMVCILRKVEDDG